MYELPCYPAAKVSQTAVVVEKIELGTWLPDITALVSCSQIFQDVRLRYSDGKHLRAISAFLVKVALELGAGPSTLHLERSEATRGGRESCCLFHAN